MKAAQLKVDALESAAQAASREGAAATQDTQRLQSALKESRQQSSILTTQVTAGKLAFRTRLAHA